MLKNLKKLNPSLTFFSCEDNKFREYGRIVKGYDFTEAITWSEENVDFTKKPYVRMITDLTDMPVMEEVSDHFYGGMPLQAGWCIGVNSSMNGMEYHKGSELIVAVTDMLLCLGKVSEMADNSWDSNQAVFVSITKGTAVELYGTTLHLAPIRTTESPFCALIILPLGTNSPLNLSKESEDDEKRLLWMRNKWFFCHPDSPAASKGAYKGITGPNHMVQFQKS